VVKWSKTALVLNVISTAHIINELVTRTCDPPTALTIRDVQ